MGKILGILGGDGSDLMPVVKSLIERWEKDPEFKDIWADSKVSEDLVRDTLLSLVRGGRMPMFVLAGKIAMDVVARVGGGDKDELDKVISRIKSFQDEFSIAKDGVIGRQFINLLAERFRNCVDRTREDAEEINQQGAIAKV